MPIKVLPTEVAHKIAAGEVVERPASVVKELVENALDAGATKLTIEVRGGGLHLIRVSDNGCGIAQEELRLAFERHATSKIEALDDLEGIMTLGFRGEALPSIAAVAEVTLISRTLDSVNGAQLTLRDGEVVEEGQRGCPPGTTLFVRALFRNVPARLKFLKSLGTESGHITNLVAHYALAFPEVSFTLIIDGRISFQTPPGCNQRDALAQVYGGEVAAKMLGASSESVNGLVSPPSVSRTSRTYISIFVNRRWVQSRVLSYAVEEAYHGMLMTGQHPIAVLNLTLPPGEVDVNVHPAKSEVRFRRERDVFGMVQKAVRAVLIEQMPVPQVSGEPATELPSERALPQRDPDPQQGTLIQVSQAAQTVRPALPLLRVLGQVANTYIIAEGPDGMYLVDQHAAHERVLFEKLQSQAAQRAVEVQGLLEPGAVQLTLAQEEMLQQYGDKLAEYGFTIEPFGERTCLVRAVPALMKNEDASKAVIDLLDSLGQGKASEDVTERLAIELACHGAVRAGGSLTVEEMRELVRQLESTQNPRTCPHGRPTVLHLSSSRLEKEFGRE